MPDLENSWSMTSCKNMLKELTNNSLLLHHPDFKGEMENRAKGLSWKGTSYDQIPTSELPEAIEDTRSIRDAGERSSLLSMILMARAAEEPSRQPTQSALPLAGKTFLQRDVEVKSDGTPRNTQVKINGLPVKTVTSLQFSVDANGDPARLVVELTLAHGADIDIHHALGAIAITEKELRVLAKDLGYGLLPLGGEEEAELDFVDDNGKHL